MDGNERDDRANREFGQVLDGLEKLSRRIEAERYPGLAWPAAGGRRAAHRRGWRIAVYVSAAAAVAAAAVVAIALSLRAVAPRGPTDGQEGGNALANVTTRSSPPIAPPAGAPIFLLVEDLDSYSVIDLSAGVPILSFSTKDSGAPVTVVPMPNAPPKAKAAGGKET